MNIYEIQRKAVESTYTDTMSVFEKRKVRNEKTKLTDFEETIVLEEQACKLSYEKIQNAASSDPAAAVLQTIKLFLSPDVMVALGSKIKVTHAGITEEFCRSGKPAVYLSHQEIVLVPFKEWT